MIHLISLCLLCITYNTNGNPTAIEMMDTETFSLVTLGTKTTDSIEPNSTIISMFNTATSSSSLNRDILSQLHLFNALQKVSEENEWDISFAKRVELEYGKFLYILKKYGSPAVPSNIVDKLWHQHILETKTYFKDMKVIFGRYIHHHPSYTQEEKVQTRNKFDIFASRYELEFGSMPADIWGNCQAKKQTNVDCDECDGRCSAIQCDECEHRDNMITNYKDDCSADDCWDGCNQSCHGIPGGLSNDDCSVCGGGCGTDCGTCHNCASDKDACNVAQCNPGDCHNCHNCQNS